MITRRSDLDRVQRIGVEPGTRSRLEASQLARGFKQWHPWLPEEGMGQEEVPSLSLSIYLSNNNKLWAPFKNKMRDIFS